MTLTQRVGGGSAARGTAVQQAPSKLWPDAQKCIAVCKLLLRETRAQDTLASCLDDDGAAAGAASSAASAA